MGIDGNNVISRLESTRLLVGFVSDVNGRRQRRSTRVHWYKTGYFTFVFSVSVEDPGRYFSSTPADPITPLEPLLPISLFCPPGP